MPYPFQFPIGNIYAPPWMCVSPSIAGYEDREFDVSLPTPNAINSGQFYITVPAATTQNATPTNGQQLSLDADYDFLVTELQFVVLPGVSLQPSDVRVRIRDAFGRLVTSDFVQVQNLNGVLPIVWGLKRGGILSFDFMNQNAENAAEVQVILRGWKRKPCPGVPAVPSSYIPMYKRYAVPQGVRMEDFEYYFEFSATGAIDMLKTPLPTDQDADFLWRGIQGDWNCANNDVATVGSVGLLFYDPSGTQLSVRGITAPWTSSNVGQFRESILSSGGGMVAPQYPEVLIPRGGVIECDISFGGAATVRFSLRGVKLYREGC